MDRVDSILKQWHRERPDLRVESMGTVARIQRLSKKVTQRMEVVWAKYGLNGAGFDVLATLRRSGEPYAMSPRQLIESTMVTSGTMTNRINQLVKAGLVARVKDPDDGRGALISLTAVGLDLIDSAVNEHVATQTDLTAALTPVERERLDFLLRKMSAPLEE